MKRAKRWWHILWTGEFDVSPRQLRLIYWRATLITVVVSYPAAKLWGSLVTFISWLSLIALSLALLAAAQGARTEERQEAMGVDRDGDHT